LLQDVFFCSFGFTEGTPARKISKVFGVSLDLHYLCTRNNEKEYEKVYDNGSSRHNIRSPLTSGGAAYMRVTPYEWFKWTSPSSQLSQRGGVLETEMGQFSRKWIVSTGLLPCA
jgi:hypothetical protein